jgi:hypothetical protein
MMNTTIQIGQVVRLRESFVLEDWPVSFARGARGTVIGRDGPLVRVRMHESQATAVVPPRTVEPTPEEC